MQVAKKLHKKTLKTDKKSIKHNKKKCRKEINLNEENQKK